ncbi:MAG: tetratricopeptide repeat protein [Longimicrobiales bacterium]
MREIEAPTGRRDSSGGDGPQDRRPTPEPFRAPDPGLRAGFLLSALLLAASVLVPAPLAAQDARTRVEEGNRLYAEGRFEEAHEKYLEALLSDPEAPLIRFNDGNALYQNQDYQRAMERFAEALESEDPAIRSSAWYNLGNALYRRQQLRESLEAFKQALMADPSDADAKHNLERVLEQLQEQQEQQERQQSGEDQQSQQDQQNESPGQQNQQNPQDQDEDQPQGQEGGEDRQQPQDQPREEPGDREQQPPQPQPQDADEGRSDQPQGRPGEMTPDEAQRLLEAIREDPGEVNRRRVPATGKRPRKDW